MYLNDLMQKKCMSRSELSCRSSVPPSTLRAILNGHAQLDHCDAGTLYALAKVLNTSVEEILDHYWDDPSMDSGIPKNNVTQIVHEQGSLMSFYGFVTACADSIRHQGGLGFARDVVEHQWIDVFYMKKEYRCALYLLGLVDFFYKKQRLDIPSRYQTFRNKCLDHPVYSLDTLGRYDDSDAFHKARQEARERAIPELRRFNILMTEDDIRRKV